MNPMLMAHSRPSGIAVPLVGKVNDIARRLPIVRSLDLPA
jgi:hypothetical protein